MEATQNTQNEACSGLSDLTVRLGDLPTEEGWYVALPPTADGQAEVVHVRIDEAKGGMVVDAAGQETMYSEYLWRYKEWSWSKRLQLPNVRVYGREPASPAKRPLERLVRPQGGNG